ncbi:hypothetical protein J5J10_07560 [Ciceribacter sp. L1K23]|uniref:hypothetical protein n=1 Tax=unclassified Ciceribacter TaxID=2628820 RepID=UPI001ABD9FCB|nr:MULTISPECIES: hypothetical protein [unclassified Ciceribacter]MBO3760410.1 hypothetical protein [Ciceribacter sp. L1K22]MBR0555536.1 hypothetical protein [Ciceribacter sp. L1K23]
MAIDAVRTLSRKHPLLFSAFVVSSVVALVFAGRFLYQVAYWQTHQNETVRPWMTIGYVARSWQVDPEELAEAVQLPFRRGKRQRLEDLAQEKGVPVEALIADVDQAVRALAPLAGRAVDP